MDSTDTVSWVDTHCHLQLTSASPVQLLAAAPEVSWVVAPGIDAKSSAQSVELSRQFSTEVVATAGLHPHQARRWTVEADELEEMFPEVVAIGEAGLDYYRDLAPRPIQREVFTRHAQAAVSLNKTLITHCRDAFSDVFQIIETTGVGPQTVLHCWTGGARWTKRFLELGVFFSYAGPITYPTADTIRGGAALVPPERALVETDTPYLAPFPHQGRTNQPAWVSYNGQKLAEIWQIPVTEVARHTSANAHRLFGSGLSPNPPTAT